MVDDGSAAGSDFAWYTPAPELPAQTLVAVAAGPGAVLTVTSATEQVVTLDGGAAAGGGDDQLRLPPAGSVSVPVTANATYRVRADAPCGRR